jgi:hypothetical protein
MMRLQGKVAVITGAGQGMGRAIARRFMREGAKVVAIDLNLAAALETIAGGEGFACPVNIANSAAVDAAFKDLVARMGRIDILVNNAMACTWGSLEATSTADWRAQFTGTSDHLGQHIIEFKDRAHATGVVYSKNEHECGPEWATMQMLYWDDCERIDGRWYFRRCLPCYWYDSVELHGTSGYLPMQFLSSGTNRRSDEYGGTAAYRARFAFECLAAMADAIGAGR